MPIIDVNASLIEGFARSSLTYGVSRSGKTVFNATFPRPALVCSDREGGYKSVQTMDRALWYEAAVEPLIFTVSSIGETIKYMKIIEGHVKKGRIKTLVVELSFYSDDVIASQPVDEKNGWAKFKLLEQHIAWIDGFAKRLGVRVAYNALAADPDSASKAPGGISLAGKATARKLPASTDLSGYLRVEDKGEGKIDRILHLTPYGNYPAGHRYGKKLPPLVRNPTYRALEDLIAGRVAVNAEGYIISLAEAAALAAAAATTPPPAASPDGDMPPLDALTDDLPMLGEPSPTIAAQ